MLPLTPLHALSASLTSRETSSRELVQACLDRAMAPEGEGSRTYLLLDAEAALQQADAIDAARARGSEHRPLAGIPISVKDLFDIAGQVTTSGSVVLAHEPPATIDADVVARLRAAGLIVIGRTNMTEFAYSGLGLNPHYGTPSNPYDRATGRIPGGSSSGAAVSVTDAMAAAALGSDTGGSCRIPAALTGIVGFKPTKSTMPYVGVSPLSESLDTVGTLAPTAQCCAMLHGVLAGGNAELPAAVELRGLRLGIPQTVVLDGLDSQVATAFEAALTRLSAAGVQFTDLPLTEFAEVAEINAKGGLIAAEAYAMHRARMLERGHEYDPRVKVRIEKGALQSAADYLSVHAARKDWIRRVTEKMQVVDLLVYPTVPTIAPTFTELEDDDVYGRINLAMLRNPTFINFLDGCAISLPCHEPGTAPVGLMIAGRHGDDTRVLAAAVAATAALQR